MEETEHKNLNFQYGLKHWKIWPNWAHYTYMATVDWDWVLAAPCQSTTGSQLQQSFPLRGLPGPLVNVSLCELWSKQIPSGLLNLQKDGWLGCLLDVFIYVLIDSSEAVAHLLSPHLSQIPPLIWLLPPISRPHKSSQESIPKGTQILDARGDPLVK